MGMSVATVSVRPEEALKERVTREKARRHLVDFQEYVSPWYRAARHHRLVGEYLEQVEIFIRTKGRTGIGRLLIALPPRHGKTEQVSKHFPAWVLGRLSDARIILTSYGAELAVENSRYARDIVAKDEYKAVFGELSTVDAPVMLSSDSRSTQAWDLAGPHRGGVAAAGVGGGITGKGAHLLVIDDPFKNRKEAESETYREDVWDWYTSSAYTRLEKGGAVIGMFTRWHSDDWAGRVLKKMQGEGERFVVLCLPAIWEAPRAPEGKDFEVYQKELLLGGVWVDERDPLMRKEGEALWPQKYSVEDLRRIETAIGPYDWTALYQQWPYLRSGSIFKREWFVVVESGPKAEDIAERVRYWDKAATEGGDYTAGVLMYRTLEGLYYVEHVARGQWTPYERDMEMLKAARFDAGRPGPPVQIWHQQDPGSSGIDSAQATNRMFAREGFEAHFEPVTGDKKVRAGPWSSMCEGGGVRIVLGGWNHDFIEEHIPFSKGKYDDQVDAASSSFGKLSSDILEGQLFY